MTVGEKDGLAFLFKDAENCFFLFSVIPKLRKETNQNNHAVFFKTKITFLFFVLPEVKKKE